VQHQRGPREERNVWGESQATSIGKEIHVDDDRHRRLSPTRTIEILWGGPRGDQALVSRERFPEHLKGGGSPRSYSGIWLLDQARNITAPRKGRLKTGMPEAENRKD